MSFLESYLKNLSEVSEGAAESAAKTAEEVKLKYIDKYQHRGHVTGLLLGEVQSGKTGQMFGLVAAAADAGFEIFVVLTSCINALQRQTYERALQYLDGFNICNEGDELRLKTRGVREPVVIVLKKNARVLKKWRDILTDPAYSRGRAVFIVDDEADAASLNTLVNREEQSTINLHLEEIKDTFTGSFYLQVTATPQSLLLQQAVSGWRPEFIYCFPPGQGYLGGSFFYSKPQPYTNVSTPDDELTVLLETDGIPMGLRRAFGTYLVTAYEIMKKGGGSVCNFLVHPSSRIDDHKIIVSKLTAYLEQVKHELRQSNQSGDFLEGIWKDLQASKPDITPIRDVMCWLSSGVLDKVNVITMNSGPDGDSVADIDHGMNIVVGGNTLGRGVTFKALHTVYYCRSAKKPQADTFWQHSRMFGYDRNPALMRVFMPQGLYNLFAEINNSNEVLFSEIRSGKLDELQLMFPPGIKPTRSNVIPSESLSLLVGGVNYFPPEPDQENGDLLDELLSQYKEDVPYYEVELNEVRNIIAAVGGSSGGWLFDSIRSAIEAMLEERVSSDTSRIIVRRNRDIGRQTGTLLSPDDRRLGQEREDITVLTMYRLTGNAEKGWDGVPFWVPNIKLPSHKVFYKTD
jgi:hypothetical protein